MGIIDKVKTFIANDKEKTLIAYSSNDIGTIGIAASLIDNTPRVQSYLIYNNNLVELTHRAARICVGMGIESDVDKQKKNISKILGLGHESISEHTNLITALVITNANLTELLDFLSSLKYLNYHKYELNNYETLILIGGSIRGYKHIIRNTSLNNIYVQKIIELLYSTPKEFYEDFIKDGIMEEKYFTENYTYNKCEFDSDNRETDRAHLISIDDYSWIAKTISHDFNIAVNVRDILDLCTATFLFEKISRTASHQLVRHRNSISQESQRYVDYSNSTFVNPLKDKGLDADKYLNVEILGAKHKFTMDDIANISIKLYNQLREDGLAKEDARAILPNNVTTKLYMTFTFTNLIKFLELRTAKGAQAEIRTLANEVKDIFLSNTKYIFKDEEDMYSYLEPLYKEIKYNTYDEVDEAQDEKIAIEEMSLEDMVEFSEKTSHDAIHGFEIQIETKEELDKCDKTKTVYVNSESSIFKYINDGWKRIVNS